METNKILTANILDIIFDGRNKTYGAYELRVTYNRRIKKSLLLTGAFFLLVCLTGFFAGMKSKDQLDEINVKEIEIASVRDKVVLPPVFPPVIKVQPQPNQVRSVTPIIVKDDKAAETIQNIEPDQTISTKTFASDIIDAPVNQPEIIQQSSVIEIPKAKEPEVFRSVEIEAEFPGGNTAWARYVEKTLEGFNPGEKGAAPGRYSVVVRFIVSKDGSISDVQAETNFGYGMEEQAVKCIKKGPNWKPALQNGQNVNAYRRQPITFVVDEQ